MSELYCHTGCRLEAHQRENSYVPPYTLRMSIEAFKKLQAHCFCCMAVVDVLKVNMGEHHRTTLKTDVQ